jgi:hypothetical protein
MSTRTTSSPAAGLKPPMPKHERGKEKRIELYYKYKNIRKYKVLDRLYELGHTFDKG